MNRVLIKDLNLTLDFQDQGLLIAGFSGAGKTTLLRSIAGLWHFGKGKIRFGIPIEDE